MIAAILFGAEACAEAKALKVEEARKVRRFMIRVEHEYCIVNEANSSEVKF
jgi:hypothetical protein